MVKVFKLSLIALVLQFISLNVLALDYLEVISGRVIKTSEDKLRFVLDRGIEDGLVLGEVCKFYYKGRGAYVAINYYMDMENSEWFVYQKYQDNTIPLLGEYKIRSMFPHRKDPDLMNLEPLVKLSMIKAEEEKLMKLWQQQEEQKKRKQEDVRSKRLQARKEVVKEIYEDAYDVVLPKLRLNLNASPFSFKTHSEERSIAYAAGLQNLDNKKYEYSMKYTYSLSSYTDVFSFPVRIVSNSENNLFANFDVNDFAPKWTYFAMFHGRRQRQGAFYPIFRQITFGVTGFKYDLYESDIIKDLSVSYIPVYEVFEGDEIKFNFTTFEEEVRRKNDSYWRHSFRVRVKADLNKEWKLQNVTFWKPRADNLISGFEVTDADFSNTFSIGRNVYDNFTFIYQNLYTWDSRRNVNLGLPSSEMEHIFTINYTVDFARVKF